MASTEQYETLAVCEAEEQDQGRHETMENSDKCSTRALKFRIMTWNMLACGMANDGFLLARPGESCEALRSRLVSTAAVAERVKDAHRKSESSRGKLKLDPLFAKEVVMQWPDAPPCMRDNWDKYLENENAELVHLIDWNARGERLVEEIATCSPDVLVLQECDKYEFFCQRLAQLGYSSNTAGKTNNAYPALKASRLHPDADYCNSIAEAAGQGVAFAPKKNSVARRLSNRELGEDADDDGTAIFWKEDRFQALNVDVCVVCDTASSAALKVHLKDGLLGREVCILGFHLPSGKKQEEHRHRCLKQIHSWLSVSEGPPVVLGADMNSDVWFEDGPGTCCSKIIAEEWKFGSIWDDVTRLPTTVVKMRGVASDQPSKWGELALETIDYVASSTGIVSFEANDDYPTFSKEERQKVLTMNDIDSVGKYLIPSATCPSDHRPVVAQVIL